MANIEIANTNSAISLRDNVITGVNNGYATLLITSKRYPDVLIVYNITVGYAPLTIASVQPSASKLNNYETLAWDITFAGGRPNYNVNFKVYRGTTVVARKPQRAASPSTISRRWRALTCWKSPLPPLMGSPSPSAPARRWCRTTRL